MKKFLLTLTLSVIWFIGFSSAFTITNNGWIYTPSVINFSESITIPEFNFDEYFPSYSCTDSNDCCIAFSNGVQNCEIYKDKWLASYWDCSDLIWNYQVVSCSYITYFWTFDSLDVGIPGVSSVSENNWNNNWSGTISQILPNWFSDLSPAISWIYDVIHQLLPYVVYIWIGVLISVLWFYAIKWLMSFMSWKIRKYFK